MWEKDDAVKDDAVKSMKPQITRVAAYGLVLEGRSILLCRLSAQLPRDVGRWTLPGGGVEFGEDPAAAMIRELREETGLDVRPIKLAGIDSRHVEEEHRSFHGIRIIYFAEVIGGTLTHEVQGSTDRCDWWSYEDALTLPQVDLTVAGLGLAFPNNA